MSGPVRALAELAAAAVDGEWLPPPSDARVAALARAVLAHETDGRAALATADAARARALAAEAQLLSLVGEGGGTVALREELDEARAANAALSRSSSERYAEMWLEHAGALREEAATLRARVATLESELTELKDVLAATRRGAQGTLPTMRLGGEADAPVSTLRSRRRDEDGGAA